MSCLFGFENQGRGGKFIVTSHLGGNDFLVKFENGYETLAKRGGVLSGQIKNPYTPSVSGIGYYGEGEFVCKDSGKDSVEYYIWNSVIKRCYDTKNQAKSNPTYAGCSVDPIWHNFQNFAKWYTSHPNFGKGYKLDKDLKVMGNKVYSPEYCDLIPNAVNVLLCDSGSKRGLYKLGVSYREKGSRYYAQCHIGTMTSTGGRKSEHLGYFDTEEEAFLAYKKAKEAYIKVVAEKYKSEICVEIYENLMNYEVKDNANT